MITKEYLFLKIQLTSRIFADKMCKENKKSGGLKDVSEKNFFERP